MADTEIFDSNGNSLASIPVSEKLRKILATGAEVTIIFHTPQLLRPLLGERSGSVTLRQMIPGDRVITTQPGPVRAFATLQAAVRAAKQVS